MLNVSTTNIEQLESRSSHKHTDIYIIMPKKVLILVPNLKLSGGVSNYYKILKPYLESGFTYMTRGRRVRTRFLDKFLVLCCSLWDYIAYSIRIPFYKEVVINHSLSQEGLMRDVIFMKIAAFWNVKTTIFFRGLDINIQRKIEEGKFDSFKKHLFSVKRMIVLSSDFKQKLIKWGYTGQIIKETTVVDPLLLKPNPPRKENNQRINFLFLSRVEKYKGVYELVDAFKLLQNRYNNVHLIIAGEGSETTSIEIYIKNNKIRNINFTGYVLGAMKSRAYTDADIFMFPSYSEGMPNAILEAMSFGLPIITSNVGGIPDIFVDKKNGYMTDDISPRTLCGLMEKMIKNIDERKAISTYNRSISDKFLAKNVAKRISDIFLMN